MAEPFAAQSGELGVCRRSALADEITLISTTASTRKRNHVVWSLMKKRPWSLAATKDCREPFPARNMGHDTCVSDRRIRHDTSIRRRPVGRKDYCVVWLLAIHVVT